ncbi:hypothetical protein A0H81_06290 [Grifola frondosa]|uniref:Nitrogen regulatory protein areA GATA-like domain-containing protein n=1 Tax=Grifola frondosa TaxID=5627 RepID=A0A1C7MAL7_GRIFR|nr:hypothetical protein A0H81_06290 [Grifola frondosa]
MPIPATLTSYLPVLLVSVSHSAAPDDSSFDTLPEGQVDYLSHNWKEEDVWRSWRSMTRQKNAIANGMRLENASWRTWWKQRNKLKTVSPETLNWLKDSDVTWLYGPLHIGSDWTEYTQHKSAAALLLHSGQRKTSTDAVPGPYATETAVAPKKPILKRRSISQLLSLPASPFFSQCDTDEDSTPRMRAQKTMTHRRAVEQDLRLERAGLEQRGAGGKKKHISFNTFVEQCIAIEKPKLKRSNTGSGRGPRVYDAYDDGYDSELGYEYDEPSSFYLDHRTELNSDSEEDDDDVLEMRTSSSRSRSSSSSRGSPFSTTFSPDSLIAPSRSRPTLDRRASSDRERATIAPIAPTLLKSTGVGNDLATVSEGLVLTDSKDLDLVYVPPTHSHYSLPNTPNLAGVSSEEVYHHRESYFSVGTSPRTASPRIQGAGFARSHEDLVTSAALPALTRRASSGSFFPRQRPSDADAMEEDAYDYFEGPDLGVDFNDRRPHIGRRRRGMGDVRDDDEDGRGEMMRFAEGGAASVPVGRSSGSWRSASSIAGREVEMPVVVVDEASGTMEEQTERSRENSPVDVDTHSAEASRSTSYFPPTTPAMPVPRVAHTHPEVLASSPSPPSVVDRALLSPSDVGCRGRTAQSPSVSGSTTTGSYSYSHSSDSRSGSRGRSSTRNSSFSDRERSGSRSSRGTNSPLGSISPTGSSVAVGSVQARCRERESRRAGKRGGEDAERGRERTGRRLADSVSPPSVVSSPTRGSREEYQPYSPVVTDALPERLYAVATASPPSSISGSSTASAATIGPANYEADVAAPAAEEEQRSRQPTPANSPTAAFRCAMPPAAEKSSIPEKKTSSPPPAPAGGHRAQRASLDIAHEQVGTLVGRAAEIVQSARGSSVRYGTLADLSVVAR